VAVAAQLLAQTFWRALTLVLKSKLRTSNVTAGLETVGVRMPSHPWAGAD